MFATPLIDIVTPADRSPRYRLFLIKSSDFQFTITLHIDQLISADSLAFPPQ